MPLNPMTFDVSSFPQDLFGDLLIRVHEQRARGTTPPAAALARSQGGIEERRARRSTEPLRQRHIAEPCVVTQDELHVSPKFIAEPSVLQ